MGAGLGVERQEQDCRELAERHGWTVAAVHVDNDLSAYSGRPRPGYERLLTDIGSGRANAVIAWHADRLHRSPVELERFIAVCDPLGVPTHTVRAGELDLSTATGRMHARITGAVARHESEQKGERVRRQKQQSQANGLWLGGRRPFGFAPDGVTLRPTAEQLGAMYRRAHDLYAADVPQPGELHEEAGRITAEADAIADATRRVLAGDSMRSIFREWNERGLTTSTGAAWTGSKMRQMMLRPRNAGLVGNVERVIGPAQWQPIVDRDSWEALRGLLNDPSRLRNNGGVSRKLVGSFLYLCGVCGETLRSGGHRGGGLGRYTCARMHLTRAAEPVDQIVFGVVEGLLRRENIQLIPTTPDLAPMRARLDVARARAEEIAAMFGDPAYGMTADQFRVSNDTVQRELRDLESEIGRRSSGGALVGIADATDPVAVFRAADIDRQRALIDLLIKVTVKRGRQGRGRGGRYFDPETVVIEAQDDYR